jgi:hypothetical protein
MAPPTSPMKPVRVKMHCDPFDIYDSVMKEEYGDDYKNRGESGWKGSIGVPGLAKINPFKKKSEILARNSKSCTSIMTKPSPGMRWESIMNLILICGRRWA